jgi:hypothetical protein
MNRVIYSARRNLNLFAYESMAYNLETRLTNRSIHPSVDLWCSTVYKSNNICFPPFLSFAVCLSGSVKSNTTASKERQESCSCFDQQFPVFLDQERKK